MESSWEPRAPPCESREMRVWLWLRLVGGGLEADTELTGPTCQGCNSGGIDSWIEQRILSNAYLFPELAGNIVPPLPRFVAGRPLFLMHFSALPAGLRIRVFLWAFLRYLVSYDWNREWNIEPPWIADLSSWFSLATSGFTRLTSGRSRTWLAEDSLSLSFSILHFFSNWSFSISDCLCLRPLG